MKLMRAAPYGTVKQEFDRLFDRFFEPNFWPLNAPRSLENMWEPVLDLSETEKEFLIRLEAPGMTRRCRRFRPRNFPTDTCRAPAWASRHPSGFPVCWPVHARSAMYPTSDAIPYVGGEQTWFAAASSA